MPPTDKPSLKIRTARTLKWNVIDRVATQALYAVTGIVLARELSQEDFGLVGAILVFESFASLLVDSGFSSALIQRKNPTQTDYSTVMWFNLGVAGLLYAILFLCAPAIAAFFQHDTRLIPLSRVMFLTLILNAAASVPTYRLIKNMEVKMVAVANSLALTLAGITGIWLAVAGFGAWAIVWQGVVLSTVKPLVLWTSQRWRPSAVFSWKALRSFLHVGVNMTFTSFLNTLFLNIYSLFIGRLSGMRQLGYYTQSDKWSKMGVMSLYQTLTSSFLPALSAVQDDRERFARAAAKMNRFTSYLVFPLLLGLALMARPIFHILFGTKWDPSIILFQLLLMRGIFTIFTGLYNNILLSLGHARTIMWMEVVKDSVAIAALVATLPFITMSTADAPVLGLTIMLYGQLLAAAVAWLITLGQVGRLTGLGMMSWIRQMLPYAALSTIIVLALWYASQWIDNDALTLTVQAVGGIVLYTGAGYMSGSIIQRDVLGFIFRKKI